MKKSSRVLSCLLVAGMATAPLVRADAAAVAQRAVVVGAVTDHGAGRAGVDVVAIAWPNDQTLATLHRGDVVPNALVGRTRTGRDGHFQVSVAAGPLPSMFIAPDGGVDVQLLVGDAARETRFSLTLPASTATAGGAQTAYDLAGGTPPVVDVDLGAGTALLESDDPAAWVADNGAPLTSAGVAAASHVNVTTPSAFLHQFATEPVTSLRPTTLAETRKDTCHNYTGDDHNGRDERFANIYAWAGAKATVTESSGTDHTVGIGSTTKSDGSNMTQQGTKTVTYSASGTQVAVDAALYNKVNYRDYYNSCVPGFDRRPYSMGALLSGAAQIGHTNFGGGCTTYSSGTFTKDTGTNVTYGLGVDIGPISVSAQSGWNSGTKVTWTVTRKSKLCGSASSGWVSSPQAETHAS